MLLLLALWACETALPAIPQAPPPPSPEVSALVTGLPATVSVSLPLGPGVSVVFVEGDLGPGPCHAALGGACLSVRSPRLLGRTTTDTAGLARLGFVVSRPAGSDLAVQAVVWAPRGARLTATRSGVVLAQDADGDRDGLINALEVAAGTDVARPDTDAGGVYDGQEVLVDHTDPLAPADDVGRETSCVGGVDDDADRLVDCADSDCAGQPACVEDCTNRVDDDRDRRVDCADTDCVGRPGCVEVCGNGVDDNRNGVADCQDPACPACVEVCGNGVDDDFDFAADCVDADCGCVEVCGDGADNDADGLADCGDVDCGCVEDCGNGSDDDRDLRADCLDDDCACVELCVEGVDSDGDGLSGCADTDCACGEVCGNGVDDDADGLADCEDAACTDLCVEDCDDGVDDDGDLWIDCQDEECWSAPGCEPDEVLAWVRAGTVRSYVRESNEWGSACWYNGHSESFDGTAEQVAGRVRVERDGRAETCDWRVDRVDMDEVHRVQFLSGSGGWGTCYAVHVDWDAVTRTGFRVAPGCGLDGSDFLPQQLKPAIVRPPGGQWSMSAGFEGKAVAQLPDGRSWYRGDLGLGVFADVRSYNWGDWVSRSSAVSRPLAPTMAFGVCDAGTPALVPGPDALTGECAP